MSSTEPNRCISRWRSAARTGERLIEQLPMTRELTPCSGVGVALRSQHSCGS